MLLAIDTSTRHAGIALAQEGQVISCRNWYSQTNHSADLVPAISGTLDQHGLSPKDLDGIACALGPGSFSALRVGLSTAKGLAMASEIPLVGIKTLELEAYPFLFNGIPVKHFPLFLKECEWRFNNPSPKAQLKQIKQWVKQYMG